MFYNVNSFMFKFVFFSVEIGHLGVGWVVFLRAISKILHKLKNTTFQSPPPPFFYMCLKNF